jgi:hypothetical protein
LLVRDFSVQKAARVPSAIQVGIRVTHADSKVLVVDPPVPRHLVRERTEMLSKVFEPLNEQ